MPQALSNLQENLPDLPLDSLGRLLTDHGPVYAETQLDRLIAEPFNAASALVFVGIAMYWSVWLWKARVASRFLVLATGLLLVGGIGGTVYHAFRYSQVFLVMDWLPILLICLSAGMWYFRQATGTWLPACLSLIAVLLLQGVSFYTLTPAVSVNISYVLMASLVLVPTILLLTKTQWAGGRLVLLAGICFVLAISFRLSDHTVHWPMGSHFLWHVFGAIACHSMFSYSYRVATGPPIR